MAPITTPKTALKTSANSFAGRAFQNPARPAPIAARAGLAPQLLRECGPRAGCTARPPTEVYTA